MFSAFALSLGASLALQAIILGWLFRTTVAPLWQKITVPALMVVAALWVPFSAARMMGFPVEVTSEDLPDHAEMVAFVPHDNAGTVDLWLRVDDVPRAYELKLTMSLKKALREAGEAKEHGRAAIMSKAKRGGPSGPSDPLGIGADDEELYELDPSALSELPPKE